MDMYEPQDAGNGREAGRRGSGGPGGSEAARGWLRIQLAVVGFVGFCSVMWAGGTSSAPPWAESIAAVLAVSAFAVALVSIYLVGTVAYGPPGADEGVAATTQRLRSTRLRTGIVLTYVAAAAVVAATLTAWWPATEDTPAVQVRGSDSSLCGELLAGPDGALRLDTAEGVVDVALSAITSVAPVADC